MTKGGRREGAGRPVGTGKFSVKTLPMRVPQHLVPSILQLAEGREATNIPFYDYTVPAGFPSPAEDFAGSRVELGSFLVPPGTEAATIIVKLAGRSMEGIGLMDGDLLVIDCSKKPVHNSIVVAEIDNDFTVKRLSLKDGEAWLVPENPDFSPIRIDQKEVRIVGVVKWRIGKMC